MRVLAVVGAVLGFANLLLLGLGRGLGAEAGDPAPAASIDGAEWLYLAASLIAVAAAVVLRRTPRTAAVALIVAAALGWLAPFLWEGYWVAGELASWSLAAVPMLAAAALTLASPSPGR